MPTSASVTLTRNRLQPAYAGVPHPTISIKLPASKTYSAGQVLGELIGNNEVQTITITATGGTFTITFGGQTTSALAYNASLATVLAALEALSTIGTGNITVTGTPGSSLVLTFIGALGNKDVAQCTLGTGSLTGGSASIATTTAGSAGTPGTFDAVDLTQTNGRQLPTAILEWDTQTDSSGNVQLELGRTIPRTSAYVGGTFNTQDLTGLTPAVMAARPGACMLQGSIGNTGVIRW